jgi:tRNA(fMet)-specific endonuclease VapC
VIILDTDIISILDFGEGDAYAALAHRLASAAPQRICVTIVSFEEQMRGWLSYVSASRTLKRQVEGYRRLHRLLDWYAQQEVLDFTNSAAARFENRQRSRVRVGTMDLRIASIALDHDALLLSRNV